MVFVGGPEYIQRVKQIRMVDGCHFKHYKSSNLSIHSRYREEILHGGQSAIVNHKSKFRIFGQVEAQDRYLLT